MLEFALNTNELAESVVSGLSKVKVIPNAKHVLCPPSWVFFEDVPGLASKFGLFLESNVIARTPGTWHAMAAVGVRSLSDAVVVDLAECEDPNRAEPFELAIRDRRAQLARVLEAHSSGLADRLERLDPLQAHSVCTLAVQYKLHAFNCDKTSEAEAVQAHYHRGSNISISFLRTGFRHGTASPVNWRYCSALMSNLDNWPQESRKCWRPNRLNRRA